MKAIRTDKFVKKSNELIFAPNKKLTINEQKIVLYALTKLRKEDDNFTFMKIPLKNIISKMNIGSDKIYSKIDQITDSLMEKFVRIENKETGDIDKMAWFGHCKYKKGQGFIKVKFYEDLKPYLLELKKHFTIYHVNNVIQLTSGYAVRLYEILKAWLKSEYTMYLSDLKTKLGVEGKSYKGKYAFGNIKKFVVSPAVKQISKHTDLKVSYDEIKEGRKKIGFKFYIQEQEPSWEKELEEDTQRKLFEDRTVAFSNNPRKYFIDYFSQLMDQETVEDYFEDIEIDIFKPKTIQFKSKTPEKIKRLKDYLGDDIKRICKEKRYKLEFV